MGHGPLDYASGSMAHDVVELLISAGADVNTQGYSSKTPLDESLGTGEGYDIGYLDTDMDKDFTNNPLLTFPLQVAGPWGRKFAWHLEFSSPLGDKKIDYRLTIDSTPRKSIEGNTSISWHFKVEDLVFFFGNGEMIFYPSMSEALKGKPVCVGSKLDVKINHSTKGHKVVISAVLKDANGCSLIGILTSHGKLSPQLTLLTASGKSVIQEKMGFG